MYKFRFSNKKKIFILFFIIFIVSFTFVYFNLIKLESFSNYFNTELQKRFYINNKDKTDKEENVVRVVDITKNEEKKEDSIIKKYNPIVYIYNTHETERYKNEFKSEYSITPDVKLASYILKDYLNDYDIDSYVETRSTTEYIKKNNLEYPKTYYASRLYLKDILKKYDFKIVIDLHRDSVSPVLEYKKNKYAKIMFVLGMDHKNYKNNEKFVEDLSEKLNKEIKGISRGIYKRKNVVFNQDLSKRGILVELGGVDNTLIEINNALKVFAKVLSDYIKENKL